MNLNSIRKDFPLLAASNPPAAAVTASGEYIINLNEKCNNVCLFCSSADTIGRRPVSTLKEISRKIKAAADEGYQKVNFFGGEPTTYNFLLAAIRYASCLGLKSTLNTNARKFSSPSYAQKFKCLAVLCINTSLHHCRPEIHDRITQIKGSFRETISGFKNILRLNIPLLVNVVINELNYRDLPEIIRFTDRLGVKIIKFSGLVSAGRILANTQLFPRLAKIKPFLAAGFSVAQHNRQRFLAEKLPLCLAPQYRDCFIFDSAGADFFEKLPGCEKCRVGDYCNGVDRKYLELFPTDKKLIKKWIIK